MTEGRTTYVPKDAAWWRRSRIVELGQQHGPAGPAVIDWLTCEARTQGPIRGHDGGVKSGYAAVAYGCFLAGGSNEARTVVATAVELGLLDGFEERNEGRTFTCRISGWRTDVDTPLEALRKAGQRANSNEKPGTSGDKKGHRGTPGDTPGQSRPQPDTPDAWPEDLPTPMHAVAEHVHQRLLKLATDKQGADPGLVTLKRVGAILVDFPDHNHRKLVGDVDDYWRHGGGAKTRRKDIARVYRDWCGRQVAANNGQTNGHPAVPRASIADRLGAQ